MLYKAEMVQRIMDLIDPKWQTRRPITFSNSTTDGMVSRQEWPDLRWEEAELDYDTDLDCPFWLVPFKTIHVRVYPRIRPGDIIWVKETFQVFVAAAYKSVPMKVINPQPGICCLGYAATEQQRQDEYGGELFTGPWRSSMLMPRWVSRIDLKVLQMRSQRIQEISAMDAIAEGIKRSNAPSVASRVICEINAFHALWDSINVSRGYAWADNHPVWIHDFERVTPI